MHQQLHLKLLRRLIKSSLFPSITLNHVLFSQLESPMYFQIVVLFTDGNTEDGDGRLLDTFKLLNAEKVLRVDNNINLVGALIPNVNNTQRIDQLKSIVSEPNDAIEVELTEANLNKIADRLAFRIRRLLVCRGKRFSLIFQWVVFEKHCCQAKLISQVCKYVMSSMPTGLAFS